MVTFKRFEDIEVWQKARLLSKEIYILTKHHSFQDEPEIKRQLKRSFGSVMDNIAEGFERAGNNEFAHF